MANFLLITVVISVGTVIYSNALPQGFNLEQQNFRSNPKSTQTLNLEGLDYLLRYANTMFERHLNSESAQTEKPENLKEKVLPINENSYNYYMPLLMSFNDEKIDNKNKHLLKISPPEKSNEPNYYSAKPRKIPKKYSSTVKHVNIKREAVSSNQHKEEVQQNKDFVAPKMSYDWIPIIGHNHKNARGNYDVVYGAYDNVESHPPVPERNNNQDEIVKSNVRKVKSRSRRGVYDILSKNERLQYQMHGFAGPKTYKFGYDTGKGKDRQFRFEERKNDGSVRGEYGYIDGEGKMNVVRYSSNKETGFQVQH